MNILSLEAIHKQFADRPLLGMDVLGRLHWQQRDGVMRIDLRPTQPS